MRSSILALAALALAAGLPAAAPAADLSLAVDRLTLRVPAPRADRAPKHRLVLKARFDVDPALDTFDAATDDVRLTIGGFEVFSLPAVEARDGLRSKKALQWSYRGDRRAGRPLLKLDLATLSVKLRAKRLDLSAISGGDTSDLEVALHLGDAVFCGTVDLGRERQRLVLVPAEPDPAPPRDPGDPGDPGDPRDGPLSLSRVDVGQFSALQRPENAVARTPGEWSALWARHGGRGAAPRVDFTTEMAVAVFLGQRPDPAYSVGIDSATARGDDVAVAYTETVRTSGVFATVVTTPYAIVRVPARSGRVTFTGRVVRVP